MNMDLSNKFFTLLICQAWRGTPSRQILDLYIIFMALAPDCLVHGIILSLRLPTNSGSLGTKTLLRSS
uniref:Uncharacterized protein n=1 Tax=Arundo donax TaxID=35708 RepID=A0A0A9B2E9_ARUDO